MSYKIRKYIESINVIEYVTDYINEYLYVCVRGGVCVCVCVRVCVCV